MFNFVKGDLFKGVEDAYAKVLIAHIVNNKGGWGKGFVVPLAKHYPTAKEVFCEVKFPVLGATYCTSPLNRVRVANMTAQDGYATIKKPRAVNYRALTCCLETVNHIACDEKREIHMPKIGAGLGGGNWEFILELIKDTLVSTPVFIYEV